MEAGNFLDEYLSNLDERDGKEIEVTIDDSELYNLVKKSDKIIKDILKERIYIKNPAEAPQGVRVQEGKRGGLFYESEGTIQTKPDNQESDKADFLYILRYDYINDFDKKNPQIFENFYHNLSPELRDNHSFIVPFADIANNLSESISMRLSHVPIILKPENKFSDLTDYWAAAYDPDYKYVAINNDVYTSLSRDYYTQEQYHRVTLHEYGHKLIYDGVVPEKMIFDLWDTQERVSKQARLDYDENLADSFAAFMMSLSSEGVREENRELRDFREEFPKSYEIWINWLKEVQDYEV